MKLIIEDDEGHRTVVPFVRDEITIGRQEGNTIRLTERNVSRRHARLVRHNGHVVVEDLGSANGIHVNGERISEPAAVKDGDLIQIGDYDLAIQQDGAAESTEIRPRPMAHADDDSDEDDELDTATGLDEPAAEQTEPEPEAEPQDEAPEEEPEPVSAPGRSSTAVIRVEALNPAANAPPEDLAPEAAPRLVVVNTGLGGREFACIRTVLQIGRTDENDITLDHPSLSRAHAKLFRTPEGEWRIIDVGSSNGLKVNGETYAQCPVVHGDTIELGHVKLAFVAPGKPFRYVPDSETKKKGGGSGAWIAVLVVVLIAGGAGYWRYSKHLPPFDIKAPPATPQPTPVAIVPHPGPPKPVEPAHEEAPPLASDLLDQAKRAADARDFDKALALLDRIQGPSVDEAAEAKALRDRATRELAAKQAIDAADHAIGDGDLDSARAQLSHAADTEAFRHELAQAEHRLRLAQRGHHGRVRSASSAAENGPTATSLYDQGRSLLRAAQFREAATTFGQCLEIDPKMARCHMLLGASLAQLAAKNPDVKASTAQLDEAALHYRKFIELAGPEDAREVDKVKQILRSYEAQRHP